MQCYCCILVIKEKMMPNWVHNTLTLTGPSDDIKAFKNRLTGFALFNTFVPMPNKVRASLKENSIFIKNALGGDLDLSKAIKKGDSKHPDWYEWRIKHWGTKWDADIQQEPVY